MFDTFVRLRPRLSGSRLLARDHRSPSCRPHVARNSRFLVSWDIGVVLYLFSPAQLAARSSPESIRKRARVEDVGAVAIFS